jgi:cell division protein FtsZ
MEVKPEIETFAKIKIVGIGGGGGSALNRMIDSDIKGVEFISINTDVQALHYSRASKKLHIGKTVTKGLGAGMDPDLGYKAAEESQNEIREALKDADMVFLTCGLGGGTGSGATPMIADIAREIGALTVAVVTKPFSFEGAQRKVIADQSWGQLSDKVDTIITIQNDRLLQIIDKQTSLLEAFDIVDDVLRNAVQGISELVTVPGLINVDFADVRSIMYEQGTALMGMGEASGENRAVEAAKAAISSPLLELSMEGARGVLFIVSGGQDLSMHEVNEAAKVITASADSDAKIIFGTIVDENLGDKVKLTVIATGFSDTPVKDRESESKGPLNQKEETYKPSNFLVKESVKEEEEKEKDKAKVKESEPQKPQKEDYKVPADNDKEDSDDEDLDIPAFIRKKMM